MTEVVECANVNSPDFTYPFLKGIDPARPPATVVVPQKYLDAMGNMERQYWEIKSQQFNILIFFKKGKFYELYDSDAVIANREFGLKMVFDTTNRGKMRLAGVPEQSFGEWARLFVFRGYKVGRVEQLKEGDGDGGVSPAAKAKVVPRELVEVLTPGTLTDLAMLSDHKEIYILSLVPSLVDGCVDAVAVDLSRRVVHRCPCSGTEAGAVVKQEDEVGGGKPVLKKVPCDTALRALTTLLQQLHPKEVIMPDASSFATNDPATNQVFTQAIAVVTKWVESEGFLVEHLQRLNSSCGRPRGLQPNGAGEVCGEDLNNPLTAQALLAQYFHKLHLAREVPLLAEAAPYTAHLTFTTATTTPATGATSEGSDVPAVAPLAYLAWEKKWDRGLVLDASTVSNLELVTNLQDGGERNSLNHHLNHCCTNGGKRLFRTWVLHPSSSSVVITARQEVVRFLRDHEVGGDWADSESEVEPQSTLSSTPGSKRPRPSDRGAASFTARFAGLFGVDFERNLSRLIDMKAERPDISYVDPLVEYRRNLSLILSTIQAFTEMVEWGRQFRLETHRAAASQGGSQPSFAIPPLLEELLHHIEAASHSIDVITTLFDRREAAESGLLIPARGTAPDYDAAVDHLATLEGKLHAARKRAEQEAFHGAAVTFSDLGKDLFMFEVAAADAPRVSPPGMVERTRSAKSVKYVVDALGPLVEAHKTATAAKSSGLLRVLRQVATRICVHCPVLYTATHALSYFDCLMNLSRLVKRYPTVVFPTLEDAGARGAHDDAFLCIENAVHPMLFSTAVPNSLHLDATHGRVLVLTGPNMAGKSTLMRTVAVNTLLAQLGGPVLATAMTFRPVDRVFTRIGARDATLKGQSTLFVELSETAEILRCATGRSLCLIDELGRGTSTHDGLAIAHATLRALKTTAPTPPLTLFSTHYHALALEEARRDHSAENQKESLRVQLGYMDFLLGSNQKTNHNAVTGVPTITFLYRLVHGICSRSYGVEVALMAGIPPHLVQLAKEKSTALAQRVAQHEDAHTINLFFQEA